MSSGDILVSNSGTDSVLVLTSSGQYKNTALELTSTTENIFGLYFDSQYNRLLVVIDGADRVLSVDATDCSVSEFTTDTNITGNMRGITRLLSGDVLVVDGAIERLNVLSSGIGSRTTAGGFPMTPQTGPVDIDALSNGGFVHCSSTADVVRTYTAAGVGVSAAVASGIAATTDAAACRELASGNIAVAWSGTTDTVRIYNSALSSTVVDFSNLSVLSTPGGLAQGSNGNILAVDRALHHIVEFTEAGSLVRTFGGSFLSTPEFIEVVP